MAILTPKGVPSAKYAPGRTWKRHMRIENVARLTATAMYTNEQIANMLGVVPQTIIAIRQTAEFQAKMIEISTGVISQHDKDLREDIENCREELRASLPLALLNLRSLALSKNENIRLKASMEIMDREGTLSKVSRTSVTLNEKPDLADVNALATDIMSVLRSSLAGATSGAAPSFTVTADEAKTQAKLMEDAITKDTLEEIDLSGKQVQ